MTDSFVYAKLFVNNCHHRCHEDRGRCGHRNLACSGEDILFPMSAPSGSARTAAKWRSSDDAWLDHVVLVESDLEWLAPVRHLTLWAVKAPERFFSRLPFLQGLDVRGGSSKSAAFVEGCADLRYLVINQVRGLHDLTAVGDLTSLELLQLYGLPQVRTLPSLARLDALRRLDLGSMKGIEGLAPLLDAPGLEELQLSRAVSLAPSDPTCIAEHPTLAAFDWFAEDVPDKVWIPVVERVAKPKTRSMHAKDWFDSRS